MNNDKKIVRLEYTLQSILKLLREQQIPENEV